MAAGCDGGLQVIDISNPTKPQDAGYHDTPGWAYSVFASGGYTFVADGEAGLQVYQFVGTHDVPVTNQPPDTKIESADIDPSRGTAKFTWSGSDDTTPAKNLLYCYRLRKDSSYSGWSSWSSSTTKTYTDLSPGNYRFQVRAKDADGSVDGSPASRNFTIEPSNLQCLPLRSS